MTRRNISLPDDLDTRARAAGLNVSALARQAIVAELDRRARMARLDAWLDALDDEHGAPSERAMASARRWVAAATAVEADTERLRLDASTSARSAVERRRAAS